MTEIIVEVVGIAGEKGPLKMTFPLPDDVTTPEEIDIYGKGLAMGAGGLLYFLQPGETCKDGEPVVYTTYVATLPAFEN